MKRKKRKHLKEDELVTTVGKVALFVRNRAKEIMALGVLIIFVVFVLIISSIIKAQNSKKESLFVSEIFELRSQFDEDQGKIAELESRAGPKKFKRLAYILLATYWVEKEDFQKVEETLSNVTSGKKDMIFYQAQDLLALIEMKKKNYDKAIEIYKQIEKEKPKEYSLDGVLFHRAEAHEKKGEKDEALVLYKKIQDEFPQTAIAYDAAQKITELEVVK